MWAAVRPYRICLQPDPFYHLETAFLRKDLDKKAWFSIPELVDQDLRDKCSFDKNGISGIPERRIPRMELPQASFLK